MDDASNITHKTPDRLVRGLCVVINLTGLISILQTNASVKNKVLWRGILAVRTEIAKPHELIGAWSFRIL